MQTQLMILKAGEYMCGVVSASSPEYVSHQGPGETGLRMEKERVGGGQKSGQITACGDTRPM